MNLEDRIYRTVLIADERGYNLHIQRLSRQMLGGSEDPASVEKSVRSDPRMEMSEGYVGLRGKTRTQECLKRSRDDREMGRTYRDLAREFSQKLSESCPHIRTIAIGGSLASNGLCPGEDIDLDIVTADGTKYSTYLTALIKGILFSFRHRSISSERYFGLIPKLICVNVVWEESQVAPFVRRDEQMAYEILNSEVMIGEEYYDRMIRSNHWILDLFPQIDKGPGSVIEVKKDRTKHPLKEHLSRFIVFVFYRLVEGSRSFDCAKKEKMRRSERVKHPYGIFDVPATGGS